jgi:hypothetical protein
LYEAFQKRKLKIAALAFLALFVMSVTSMAVFAAPGTATLTVTKDSIPIEGAFVNVFKCEKNWYGAYYTTGDPVATNVTDANGQCMMSLDPAVLYQFQINNAGDQYQINALGAASITLPLGLVSQVRGNAMPWIIGGVLGLVALIFLGWIKFTNKGPFTIKA